LQAEGGGANRAGDITITAGSQTNGGSGGPGGDIRLLPGTSANSTAGILVLDYSTWPATDASGVLTSNGAGVLSWGTPAAETWAATLVAGNESSGTDAVISPGDVLRGEDVAVGKGETLTIRGGENTGVGAKGGDLILSSGESNNTAGATLSQATLRGGDIIAPFGQNGLANSVLIHGADNLHTTNAGGVELRGGNASGGSALGGDVLIRGGLSGGAVGGDVAIRSGSPTGAQFTGDIVISTDRFGSGIAATNTGSISILTTGSAGANEGGDIIVTAGSSGNVTGNIPGDISLTAGDQAGSLDNSAPGGSLTLTAGFANGTTGSEGGGSTLQAGAQIATAGTGGTASGGGPVRLLAGDSSLDDTGGPGGLIEITAGDNTGTSSSGPGGSITVTAGSVTDGGSTSDGGDIVLTPGTASGSGSDGEVTINGKLTVTGLIDPTGLVLAEQSSDPASTGAGEGTFWTRDDVPTVPMFTDDAGTDWQLAGAGSFVTGVTPTWSFQTNTATGFAAGFYEFSGTDNDFSPSITWGTINVAKAAHFLIVTGAIPGAAVTIRVTGTSITDAGVRTAADTEDIVVAGATAVSSYFETSKKWNGQVTVSVFAGTPITCNYGWSKYFDLQNQNFNLAGLECLWESDSTDSGSNIEMLHHKSTGWTFNAGADPTVPTPIASRATDFGVENDQEIGQGAWKRTNFSLSIAGAGSEGILFRITSGSTGIGSLSFRNMTLQATCIVP
jgi:hypothetical protein